MPTYEYECADCKRVFEVRQRISEPPLTVCDKCGGPVRRLLAAAPFILKGGGWYVTDYPSESRKKAMKSESPSTSGQSGTSDSGSSSTSSSSSGGDSGKTSSNGGGSTSSTSSDGAKSTSKAKPKAKS